MTWWNSGNWNSGGDGLPLDPNLKNIVAQVCFAINQREAAQGRAETAWTYLGGTKTRPVAADFVGMSTEAMTVNLEPIRNAINTLTGAYENEETRTRWVNSSNTEFLYSYSGNTILSVPALRMGDYVFWNAVKSTLEDMRYLCWYRTANNIVPSSCHDYLFEDMTYSEAWNEAYTYGTNSIYDEQIAYWHMAAGIVVQINAGAYIHVDVGTTAQRGTCRLWKISRTWTHTDVVSAIGVESLAWNASDNVTMTASGSGTDVINGVVGRALLQTMFYGPLSWLSPFDNAPGHAELGIVYGLVNDLSNITKTCVFTELEVGTHLTYG